MNYELKRFLLLLLSLLLICSFAFAAPPVQAQTKICLYCGAETASDLCDQCHELAEAWTCISCGTRNLSDTCSQCGLERQASLEKQAADPRPQLAFPAVRFLAAAGDPASLLRLGQFYEKGIGVGKDIDQAVSCLRRAGEAGYAPAWIYLGRLYDAGVDMKQDPAEALNCYRKAADLGSPEGNWYIGSF